MASFHGMLSRNGHGVVIMYAGLFRGSFVRPFIYAQDVVRSSANNEPGCGNGCRGNEVVAVESIYRAARETVTGRETMAPATVVSDRGPAATGNLGRGSRDTRRPSRRVARAVIAAIYGRTSTTLLLFALVPLHHP